MCVIVYSPKNVGLPKMETLKLCYERNPHGVGMMFRIDSNNIQVLKGFMSFEGFKETLKDLKSEINFKNTEVAIHFRFATHGDQVPELCHPFIVTPDYDEMRITNTIVDEAVMHNGVIQGYTPSINENLVSDTMMFISKNCDNIKEAFKKTGSNKFCYMHDKGTTLHGNFNKINGIFYSNTYFLGYSSSNFRKKNNFSNISNVRTVTKTVPTVHGYKQVKLKQYELEEDKLEKQRLADYKKWEEEQGFEFQGFENESSRYLRDSVRKTY